jgi:serralysin
VKHQNKIISVLRDGETDTLIEIERVDLTDGDFIFDLDFQNTAFLAGYWLYGGAFDRTPDEGGLRYWLQRLDASVSLHEVASGFLESKEFLFRYGERLSNSAFINALYENSLSRPADQEGLRYWQDLLERNIVDRANLLINFTSSSEYVESIRADFENGFWVV